MLSAPFQTHISGSEIAPEAYWRTCPDGVKIRLAVWKGGPKGTILLFPGRTEFIEKYGGVAEEFLKLGYSVLSVDWRGQGIADRVHPERQMGHVTQFSDYQMDAAEAMALAAEMDLPRPYTMLAHSMGGAIGLRHLHNGANVDAAIFSAPMWGIYLEGPLKIVAKGVLAVMPRLGMANRIAPTRSLKNYVEEHGFEGNTLTNDPETFAWLQAQMAEHPELGIGGPSVHWLKEALQETKDLDNIGPAAQNCLCIVGTQEAIVSTNAINSIMARWGNGKLVTLEDAQHEVFMETPETKAKVWEEVQTFLDSIQKA